MLFPEHDELQSDDVTLLVVNLSFPQTRKHTLAFASQQKSKQHPLIAVHTRDCKDEGNGHLQHCDEFPTAD